MKKAVSLTLNAANVLWLKGQAAASPEASVSGVVDRLLTEARLAGRIAPGSVRSVVGSIDLPEDDPDFAHADSHIRAIFERSTSRPVLVKDRRTSSRPQRG